MEKTKIAIQKGGRLSDKSIEILKNCGLDLNLGHNKLKASVPNSNLELLFLRDDDIPKYVENGVAHFGIVGENVVAEEQRKVKVVANMGFGKCRLSLAIPRGEKYPGLEYFQGKRIATSYSALLKKYLEENNIQASIHTISGSVEIAPGIGLADGVLDIVSSGSTLAMNGLKEVETVMRSQAVLIANPNLEPEQQKALDQLLFRIKAVQQGKSNRYILLNAPNEKLDEIAAVLPGINSPTVMPLLKEGWSSVHSVVKEDEVWDIIDQLHKLGAEGILVVPIEKMFD
ncbi:MAG: ATP phosphoribosyltransferase [Luteibaculum sp.]